MNSNVRKNFDMAYPFTCSIDALGCLKFFKRFKVFLTLEFYSEPNHFDMEK